MTTLAGGFQTGALIESGIDPVVAEKLLGRPCLCRPG